MSYSVFYVIKKKKVKTYVRITEIVIIKEKSKVSHIYKLFWI